MYSRLRPTTGLGSNASFRSWRPSRASPPRKPAHLKILAIAPTFEGVIPTIKATEKDVDDLTKFFPRHFVTEPGEPFPMLQQDPGVVLKAGKQATAANVLRAP